MCFGACVLGPEKLRKPVLEMLHEGHLVIVRMKALARGYLWWPGLHCDLEKLDKACLQSQKKQNLPGCC